MKTPNDHIFRLIQAMTAAEKRYFKVHFASDDSLLTQLFDHLNHINTYQEEKIKKHFAGTSIAKNLKVYKVQLSEAVLKSLAAFNHKKGLKDKLRIGIEEVNALRAKQLFNHATNKLSQLKKLATTHHQYHYLLHLLQIELELGTHLLNALPRSTSQEYESTLQKVMLNQQLRTQNEYLDSLLQTNFLTQLTPEQLSEIEQQQLEHLEPIDFVGRYYQLSSKAAIAILLKGDTTLAIQHYLTIISQLKSDTSPSLQDIHPELSWQVHYHLLQAYLRIEEFEQAKQLIIELEKWLGKTTGLQQCRFYLSYLKIEIAYRQADYDEIVNLENAFFTTVDSLKKVERYEVFKGLAFLTLSHLQRKDFAKAQFYLRRLHGFAKKLPKALGSFFDLLELLSHYASQEITITQNLATAYKRKQYDPNKGSILFADLLEAFLKLSSHQQQLPFAFSAAKYQNDTLRPLYQYFVLERFISLQFSEEN
ncbi:MAG: hypothetical protein AB8G22_12085 [Saprospiraceae bacterium]